METPFHAAVLVGIVLLILGAVVALIVVDVQGRSKAYRMAFRNGLAGAPMVDFSGFDLEWSTGVSPEIGAKTAIAPYQTIVASKAK